MGIAPLSFMSPSMRALVVVLVPFVAACATPRDSGVSIREAHSPIVKACPLGVPETRIDVEDTPDGVDAVFKTSAANVGELRHRVRDQAAIHGPEAHQGAGHGGVHGTGQGHGLRLWDMPVKEATANETEDGSRLHVIASDAAHVADLRARVRERIATLDSHDCP
jgi:hypothetical protein